MPPSESWVEVYKARLHSPALDTLSTLLDRSNEIAAGKSVAFKTLEKTFATEVDQKLNNLPIEEMAELFVSAAHFATACESLIEHHWLQTHGLKEHQGAFDSLLSAALERELSSMAFLAPLLRNVTPQDLKLSKNKARAIVASIKSRVKSSIDKGAFREFARVAMREMNELVQLESELESSQGYATQNFQSRLKSLEQAETQADWTQARALPTESFVNNHIYRAFDDMDDVFGLDFDRDKKMQINSGERERLYEGAGRGVQTSYSSLMVLLEKLSLPTGARFIDLGSGYGRVGLVIGLLRPDMEFIGYEYVPHRVEISQSSAQRAGLSERIHFVTQDLSDPNFRIPEADVYYMFDPFTEETYRHVFAQLIEIGRHMSTLVITKGPANDWFTNAVVGEEWKRSASFDEGTLGVFHSPFATQVAIQDAIQAPQL